MEVSPLAGKPADPSILIDVPKLVAAYYSGRPDPGNDPGEHYLRLTAALGNPYYERVDAPATAKQKERLENLYPETVTASKLANGPITAKLTNAPGNNAPIGGLKVITASGWFAARPSGRGSIYKIYAESFRDRAHLDAILIEAQEIVNKAMEVKS
jgi:phosphoglucomutase